MAASNPNVAATPQAENPSAGLLVGEPILAEGEKGPYYNQNVATAMLSSGQWGTTMTDCCADPGVCLCSVCCPCVVLFQSLTKTGPVRTPLGFLNRSHYALCFLALMLVDWPLSELGPNLKCVKIPKNFDEEFEESDGRILLETTASALVASPLSPGHFAAHGHSFFTDAAQTRRLQESDVGEIGHLGDIDSSSTGEKEEMKEYCTTLGQMISRVFFFILAFFTLRGIRDKVLVKEEDWLTAFKSAPFPEICLCYQCCYVSQVARHVNQISGFSAPTVVVGQPVQTEAPVQGTVVAPSAPPR